MGLVLATCFALPAEARPQGTYPAYDFIVCGHVRGDATGELLGYLPELLAEIGRLEPDFVVLAGDLVWGDVNDAATDVAGVRADWERLDAAFETLGVPIYRVPGNHDINDRATRDLWIERYGPLPAAVPLGDTLLLFVSSSWIPADDDPRKHPASFIRGKQLDEGQITFLERELTTGSHDHAFVFEHHMLWWEPSAPWWTEVHPLLAANDVRAVFAGDYGPLKFSHTERDGVHYLQTSVENDADLEMLRLVEESRVLSSQLDNFLHVSVTGPAPEDVRYEVRTVAALTTGKFDPARHHAVFDYEKWSLGWRLRRRWSTSERLLRGVLGVGAAGFAAGVCATALLWWLRRRRA